MDKKQILWIVLLGAGAFLMFQMLAKRTQQTAQPQAAPAAPAGIAPGAEWSFRGKLIQPGRIDRPVLGSLESDPGKDSPRYRFQVELDPRGASVYTLKLAGMYDTVEHKRKKDKTPEEIQQWSYSLLNPVSRQETTTLPLATQGVSIHGLADFSTAYDPAVGIGWNPGEVTVGEDGSQSIDFTLAIRHSQTGQGLVRLTKTYSVRPDSDSLRVSLKVENISDQPRGLSIAQFGPTGMPREDFKDDERSVAYGRLITKKGTVEVPRIISHADLLKSDAKGGERFGIGGNSEADPVLWAGQTNKFFACLMYPQPGAVPSAVMEAETSPAATQPEGSPLVVAPSDYGFSFYRQVLQQDGLEGQTSLAQLTVFQSDNQTVAPGESITFDYDVYCGPKIIDRFETAPLYKKLNYTDTIQFGGCCGIPGIAYLSRGVMWIIEKGGELFGNYGMIIIVLVLVVRLILHPITKKSQISMMKMGKMGPQMEKIKAKFKDDQQQQQKEMAKFFREQGATPLLGCLPMVLQMPIWVALWQGLQATAALRHAAFLPFWITDLAGADAIISWKPVFVPVISGMMGPLGSLNLLPILLAVSMYLQQKLMPMQASAAAATPEQKQQQKIMQIFMTAFMLLIFYNQPAGLTLYVMASTAGGVVESWVIRKHIREKEAAEAAATTTVEIPGKAPRGMRPKKDKGPGFFRFK